MNISTLNQFAARAKISRRHLDRLMSTGEGPPVIELGRRRKGIADDDGDAWLRSRRVVPPGFKEGGA